MLELDRRQALVWGAGAVIAAKSLVPPRASEAIRLDFPRGAPVPPWLEVSTKPGFFGIPVEVVEEFISGPERAAFARMGYRDVPETRLRVRATAPLPVGDCLLRYEGGAEGDFRVLFAAKQPYRGRKWWSRLSQPLGTWMWTNDGSDKLLYAKVTEPEFRIVTPRLAERAFNSASDSVTLRSEFV